MINLSDSNIFALPNLYKMINRHKKALLCTKIKFLSARFNIVQSKLKNRINIFKIILYVKLTVLYVIYFCLAISYNYLS